MAFIGVAVALAGGCERYYLSDEPSRSPAISTQDGTAAPSTAVAWVERVDEGSVQVVGKAFDGTDSASASAAPVKALSPTIPIFVEGGGALFDPTSAVSGLEIVYVRTGFVVIWMQKGGPTWAQFTDLALDRVGAPIQILTLTPLPSSAQTRHEMSGYYLDYRDRVVVFMDVGSGGRWTHAVLNPTTRELLTVEELPDPGPYGDVSYDPNPNRPPFTFAFLSPLGDLDDPFRVRVALLGYNVLTESVLAVCRTDVSTPSVELNNVAAGTQLAGNRYVVWDERNGDLYGTFVNSSCGVGPPAYLGTRRIQNDNPETISARAYLPMDVRFDSNGDGVVALKEGLVNPQVRGNVTHVVSVLPLRFDGLRLNPEPLRRIGLARRFGLPYSNRSFQLVADLDGFKLVFDETRYDGGAPYPDTWRALFTTIAPP